MQKQNLPLYIAIALLLITGTWFFIRLSHKPQPQEASNQPVQKTEPGNQTPSLQSPAEVAGASTNQSNKDQVNGQCVRKFNEQTLANARVATDNTKVKLTVENFGDITVELYDKDAPKTVENFLRLVNSGFYDCLTFHRIAKGFVIQGGDPNGNGSGGISAFGGPFADELNPKTKSYQTGYKKGVLAMANAGPGTNTSQFFILLGDADWLQKNYTIFGKVVAGQSVVDKIGALDIIPTNPLEPSDGTPKQPVIIKKATIVTSK